MKWAKKKDEKVTNADIFKQIDSNSDGLLTKEEAKLVEGKKMENGMTFNSKMIFSHLDKNGDGKISQEEFTTN